MAYVKICLSPDNFYTAHTKRKLMTNSSFNTPPNWPAAPAGWVPPEGWQPDPAWGPAPAGWNFWVETPAPAPVTPPVSTTPAFPAARPFPTRRIPTSGEVGAAPALSQGPAVQQPPVQQFNQPNQVMYTQPPVNHFQPASYSQAPAPKKNAGKIVIAVVGTLAILGGLAFGGNYVLNTLLVVPVIGENENLVKAGTVEEAKQILQTTHDDANTYMKANHGIYTEVYEMQLEEYLAAGKAATTILDVESYSSMILDLKEDMAGEVAVWKKEWEGEPQFTANKSGTQQEAYLDEYSGGTVDFAIDSECDGAGPGLTGPVACVKREAPHTVHITEYYVGNPKHSNLIYADVMLHEYGHVIQSKYLYELENSTEYTTLFNENAEFHADCMAESIKPDFKTPYGSVCTPEHLAAAKKAWDGQFK